MATLELFFINYINATMSAIYGINQIQKTSPKSVELSSPMADKAKDGGGSHLFYCTTIAKFNNINQ
jgi:hypothetical protein